MENDKKVGRPLTHKTQENPMDNYNARLTAWHARMARKVGDGNLSLGLRIAIEFVVRNSEDKK